MKRFWLVSLCMVALAPAIGAIPNEINFQGTLKENGLPANKPKYVTFQLTSQDGNTPYSVAINRTVQVVNGLFAERLAFQLLPGISWETINPYIKVTVDGKTLSPNEPINPTVYAFVSNSVVDDAITTSKLADNAVSFSKLSASVQGVVIPSGMIAMFKTACPTGWTRVAQLDNKFPMGSASYGVTGGTTTHSHTVNSHVHVVPDHTHTINDGSLSVVIGIRNPGYDNNLVMQTASTVGNYSTSNANQWYGYGNGMTNPAPTGSNPANVTVLGPKIFGGTTSSGNTTTGGSSPGTDFQNQLPPYLSIIFCEKN